MRSPAHELELYPWGCISSRALTTCAAVDYRRRPAASARGTLPSCPTLRQAANGRMPPRLGAWQPKRLRYGALRLILQKRPTLEFLECLAELLLRVHHDGAVPRHGFLEWFSRD